MTKDEPGARTARWSPRVRAGVELAYGLFFLFIAATVAVVVVVRAALGRLVAENDFHPWVFVVLVVCALFGAVLLARGASRLRALRRVSSANENDPPVGGSSS